MGLAHRFEVLGPFTSTQSLSLTGGPIAPALRKLTKERDIGASHTLLVIGLFLASTDFRLPHRHRKPRERWSLLVITLILSGGGSNKSGLSPLHYPHLKSLT